MSTIKDLLKGGKKQYKKEELLVLSAGDYEEYKIETICKVLKDFTEHEVTDLFKGKKDDCSFEEEEFITMLINKGYIKKLNYKEWIFSTYSNLKFS